VDEAVVVGAEATEVVVWGIAVADSVVVVGARVLVETALLGAVVVAAAHAKLAPSRAIATNARPTIADALFPSARPVPPTIGLNPFGVGGLPQPQSYALRA
jgi:hypothetical protein